MRIGMLAPISHPYPPPGYGPWERVAHDLTEALVAAGHDVTLFAPAGSQTAARLVPTAPEPGGCRLAEEEHLAVAMAAAAGGALDVLHSHLHVHALAFAPLLPCPIVTTLHGAAWNEEHHRLLRRHAARPFVSLSDAERRFLPELNYVATVPNGIRVQDFPLGDGAGGYLAFVGRMAPEKAPELAVEVARQAGIPLRMAGIVEPQHQEFFDVAVRPGLVGGVEYTGPLERPELARLLAGAAGLVMPLRWDEPFGLVVVEALAAGTPVVAWRRGAMPEIVRHGETGFVVDGVTGAAAAVAKRADLDRAACRADAERRFGDAAMAAGYAAAYERVLSSRSPAAAPSTPPPSAPG